MNGRCCASPITANGTQNGDVLFMAERPRTYAMRKVFNKDLNKWRAHFPYVPPDLDSLDRWGPVGFFFVMHRPVPDVPAVVLRCMSSPGSSEIPWEHVSISVQVSLLPKPILRTPTWDEMNHVKSLFWDPEELVVQFHPPQSEYIDYHPHCLHLWKPWDGHIKLPPSIAIGSKQGVIGGRGVSQEQVGSIIDEVCNAPWTKPGTGSDFNKAPAARPTPPTALG